MNKRFPFSFAVKTFTLLFVYSFLFHQHVAAKRIYITKDVHNGRYINGATFSYAPGDTLVLSASQNPFTYFALEQINGTQAKPVVIINESGQVNMSDGISLLSCSYIKITGSGSGDEYGIKVEGSTSSGIGIHINGRSADIEVERIYITSKLYGFWVKHDANCDPSFNFPSWRINNISLHNNKITNIGQEAMYLGSTDPNGDRAVTCNGTITHPKPLRLGNIKVYANIIDNMRRGGIQLSGADFGDNEIWNNTITNVGFELDPAQGNGIVLGGYTHAYVHDNTINNSYSTGIFSLGSGEVRIENNKIENSGRLNGNTAGGMASIMIDTRSTSPVENTKFIIKGNTLGANTDKNVRVYNAFMTYHQGNLICNNTASTGTLTIGVAAGIEWSNCASGNQPPVAKAGIDQVIVLPANYLQLSGSATDADGLITTYNWTKIAGPGQYTITSATQAQTTVTGLVQGSYTFRLSVSDNSGAVSTDDVLITVNNPPDAGSYFQVPCRVEAESWGLMNGVQTESTEDLNGGVHVSYIDNEDWMDYYVNAPSAGTYTFNLRVSTPNPGAKFYIRKPDGTLITTVNIPVTGGWQFWQTITTSITLAQGQQTLRFVSIGNGFNFNWFELTQGGAIPPPPPVISYTPLPAKIEAENWSVMNGVQTEGTTDAGAGLNVGWIDKGDWMDYKVSVATAGVFSLKFRLSAPLGNAQFQIRKEDGSVLSTMTVPNTGGWQNWQTLTGTISLPQGQQTLRIISTNAASWNINWLEFASNNGGGSQPPTANAGSDVSITLPTNTAQLNGSGTTSNNTAAYAWSKISGPASGSLTNATSVTATLSGLVAGSYVYRLTVSDNAGANASDEVTVTVATQNAGNTNSNRIEAENWVAMQGVQTEGTTDAGGGLNVGYIHNTDWMDYIFTAPVANNYLVKFRIATPQNNARFQVKKADGTTLATLNVPNTGNYQNWQTIEAVIALTGGQQTLKLVSVDGSNWNINWMEISTGVSTGVISLIPGNSTHIEAESWNAMIGVQNENTTDAGAGLNVGWIDNNDWMEYNINAPVAGVYTIQLRLASGGQFAITSNGVAAGNIAWLNTGGYQIWKTISTTVNLTQGPQTLRLTSKDGTPNVNWMDIVAPGTTSTTQASSDISEKTNTAITQGTEPKQVISETIADDKVVFTKLFPNPVADRTTLQINNNYTGNMKVHIIDMKGSTVKTLNLNKGTKGIFQTNLSLSDLKSGTYVLSVFQTGMPIQTLQFIKL